MAAIIPSPEEFFGFIPGSDRKMIRWNKLCEYYDLLDSISDKMLVENAGLSCEGNRFIFIYVSSADNLKNLEKYRRISEKLSDPDGLNNDTIEKLADEGKVVCMQQYGLHSNEVGGPQCVPQMLYKLLTADDDSTKNILQNVIFIIAPCSEPDGQIIFTDWYNKYLGTEYEGFVSPYLRHNWAGHSNNRDGMREITLEAQHINDILIRKWHPQIFQDHHHQCPWEDRMTIAPCTDPYFEPICPITMDETALYGAHMATELTAAGRKGVVSGGNFFDGYNCSSYSSFALLHNTAGMLTENADVSIASPVVIPKEILSGYTKPSVHCPVPWEGGEWHLYDIVEQMQLASVFLLEYAASNRKKILYRMAQKALFQINRGAKGDVKAYIIPTVQHDSSACEVMLKTMQSQGVKMYTAADMFECGSALYPKGTVVVPTAQPKYALVQTFLAKIPYPEYINRRRPDGSLWIQDSANLCESLKAGVEVIPSDTVPEESVLFPYTSNERINCIMSPFGHSGENDSITLPLPANENLSYKHANILLAHGEKLQRDTKGNFTNSGGTPVRRAKVGLLKKSATWNEEEGFTRSLLKMYSFDYEIVLDKTIRESGVPEYIDVLIIPGDDNASLSSGDVPDPQRPPEHHSGIGTAGAHHLREFVKRGGKLAAWEKSCEYINRVFGLCLQNKLAGVSSTSYSTNGSCLCACGEKHPLTLGMPKYFNLTHNNGPIFLPTANSKNSTVVARLTEDPYVNGYINGKELLADTPCIINSAFGKGNIVLYTFNPQFRNQSDATFKLLFNLLYEYE